MIGGFPVASTSVASTRSDFLPITLFFDETVNMQDVLDVDLSVNFNEAVTLQDTASIGSIEASFMDVVKTRDQVFVLLNGVLLDGWDKISRGKSNWNKIPRQ